ncbi:MAG TPA: hypothetical protein PKM88_13055 [bacterium]|nr:hypothetical protein [bacterium]
MARILIITHNDFDGIFSGAMLLAGLRERRASVEVAIATPRRLARALTELLGGFSFPDEVYIVDLALNADQEAQVARVLNQLRERGRKVFWYDHHRWDREVRDRTGYVCDVLRVDQGMKTAAQLIRDEVFPEHPHVAKLFRLLYHQAPEADTDWSREWLAYLERAVERRDPGAVRKAIYRLAYHDRPGGMAALGGWLHRFGRRAVAVADLPHRMERTACGRPLLVADLRGTNLNINAVYRQLIEHYRPGIYIAVLENSVLQCGRGEDESFSLEPLLLESHAGRLRFSVKGHRYVGAVTLRLSLASILRQVVSRGYPDEVEQFITLIKERY